MPSAYTMLYINWDISITLKKNTVEILSPLKELEQFISWLLIEVKAGILENNKYTL